MEPWKRERIGAGMGKVRLLKCIVQLPSDRTLLGADRTDGGQDVAPVLARVTPIVFLRHGVVWITMSTAVTQGIKVSARSRYTQAQSEPAANRFMYSYRITIENTGSHPVQLLRRHWMIHDSLGSRREVEGAGVVGEQPTLQPGESFTFSSFCDLKSDLGRMNGTYLMRRSDGTNFRVRIPEFVLQVPYRCN